MIVRNNTIALNKMEQEEHLIHILSQLILDLRTFCKVIFQKCLTNYRIFLKFITLKDIADLHLFQSSLKYFDMLIWLYNVLTSLTVVAQWLIYSRHPVSIV